MLASLAVSAASAPAAVVIVDNAGAGFSVLSQTWETFVADGQFRTDYRYKDTDDAAGEVEWRPTLPAAGMYHVSVWYRSTGVASRPDNARFTVHYDGGSADVFVNQQINGSTWVELGTFMFAAGNAGRVTLTSAAQAGKTIVADAVRFGTEPPAFTEQGATVLGGIMLNTRSVSFGDIDGDGDPDLLYQGAATSRKLFRNNTVGTGVADFTDISSMLHPSSTSTSSWSAAWGDFDGDNDVDVFVGQTKNPPDTGDLLRNDGAAGFVDASVATGLADPGFHQNVAWCDIDNDSDLDLVIAMEGPEKHEIYIQGPPGFFTPVGAAVGLQVPEGIKAYGMAVGDTDGDGDNDLYVSTCRSDNNIRNNFFENRLIDTGNLAFVDIADTNGTQFTTNSYGAEFHDFDDDGDLDLFMVGADSQPSKLWRNDGGNQFTDVDVIVGHTLLTNTGGDFNGGKAIDYDNDGDLDLFFHDHLAQHGKDAVRALYRNDGNWNFTEVTEEEGAASQNEDGYDSTWADYDLDGDLDLFTSAGPTFPERAFVSSASANGNHWLFIDLRGRFGNRTGIGARLYATIHAGTPQERTLRRDANANAGTFDQSDRPVHFGLGDADVVDLLRIEWPDGTIQFLANVPADQHMTAIVPTVGTCGPPPDLDCDQDVDLNDFGIFQACATGANQGPPAVGCDIADFDIDLDIDQSDFGIFQRCISGPNFPAELACAD